MINKELKPLGKYTHVFSNQEKHFRTIMKQLSLDEETVGIIISMLITLGVIVETFPLNYKKNDWKYNPLPQ